MEQKLQDITQNNRHINELEILSAGWEWWEAYNCLNPFIALKLSCNAAPQCIHGPFFV